EGAVFGHRAARVLLGDPAAEHVPACPQRTDLVYADQLLDAPAAAGPTAAAVPGDGAGAPAFSRAALQELMWADAGLTRDGDDLEGAEAVLAAWVGQPSTPRTGSGGAAGAHAGTSTPAESDATILTAHEDANLLLLARLLTRAARARTTSLG